MLVTYVVKLVAPPRSFLFTVHVGEVTQLNLVEGLAGTNCHALPSQWFMPQNAWSDASTYTYRSYSFPAGDPVEGFSSVSSQTSTSRSRPSGVSGSRSATLAVNVYVPDASVPSM